LGTPREKGVKPVLKDDTDDKATEPQFSLEQRVKALEGMVGEVWHPEWAFEAARKDDLKRITSRVSALELTVIAALLASSLAMVTYINELSNLRKLVDIK
jgi:hypothetical protein